jgi:DNA-binding GntR family transcriptional regulator
VKEASAVTSELAPGRRAYGNLKDEAAGFIRDAIVSGRMRPRAKIDQDEIAEALGFSRAPVREALIELAQKGFVLALPRRGAFVAEVSEEDVEDHYAVVGLVFALAARRAVTKLTSADVDELQRLHTAIASAGEAGTRKALDRQFFHLIVNAGRSRRLDSVLEFLGGAIQGSFYLESPGWAAHETAFRQQLLTAIEAGDVPAAAQLSEEHMRSCAAVTIEYLQATGYWSGTA